MRRNSDIGGGECELSLVTRRMWNSSVLQPAAPSVHHTDTRADTGLENNLSHSPGLAGREDRGYRVLLWQLTAVSEYKQTLNKCVGTGRYKTGNETQTIITITQLI